MSVRKDDARALMRDITRLASEGNDKHLNILTANRQVTIKISELFEIARETRDYASEQFMQWFVQEQVEEEAAMGDLLAVAERTVSVPMLLEEYLARDKPGARPE